MGDITGRPKAPASQVVYVPQYIYQEPSPSASAGGGGETPTAQATAEQREKNLLDRTRSRLGTILTGFRGILEPKDSEGQRKTLLGE